MKKVLLCGLLALSACIPGQRPSENDVLPALLAVAYKPVSPDAVRTQIVDDLFPQTGPYALIEGEKEYLQYSMYERYNDGFYEPMVQRKIARDMRDTMDEAFAEDGTTMASLNADYEQEVLRVLSRAPEFILWNIRFTTANSVIMSEEMLNQEGFFEENLNRQDFEASKELMMRVYRTVSDEIEKRGGSK
jgi:hypothetical protein